MDPIRFDRLATTVANSSSRRRLLGSFLGLALAGLLGWPQSVTGKPKKCPKGHDSCGKKCCQPEETCKKGKCKDHCNDKKKNFGETDIDCGGTCRDRKTCELVSACEQDADCTSKVCVARPDIGDGKICVVCREDRDCERLGPPDFRCFRNVCFECTRDADCPRPGQRPEQDKCVEPVNGDCPTNRPCVCRECVRNEDCAQGAFCDEDGNCEIPCSVNRDCPSGVACVGGACTGTCKTRDQACANCAAECCVAFGCNGSCCDFGHSSCEGTPGGCD